MSKSGILNAVVAVIILMIGIPIKFSVLGSVQIKTERSQTQSRRFRQEPAVIMPENVRQDV